MSQKNFHILKLEASNIKGIKAIVIEPEAGLVEVVGKNGQGKTSALDAIEMALRGKKFCPSQPIREGEEKGEITLELGDHIDNRVDLIVKRSFTEKGSYLKVTNGEGLEYKSAQAMLDALCGAMAFDPMEFTRMDAKKRSETLKKLAGLDFDDIEKVYKKVFEERSICNRDIKSLEGKLSEYEGVEEVEVPDVSDVQKRRNEAAEYNKEAAKKKSDLKRHIETVQHEEIEIEQMEAKIEGLKNRLAQRKVEIEKLELEDLSFKDLDIFDEEIKSYSEKVSENSRYQAKCDIEADLNNSKGLSESMTTKLSDLKSEKEKMLEGAKLPVDGLDFANGDVTYYGIEFEQINMAEKIKISMAMAMSLNPRLRIVRIMNGSLIDDDGMIQIKEMAEENGFDIWLEKVANEKTSANSFLITEGEISE